MRYALLTRSLEVGGAERQLVELALALKARGHEVLVVVFYPGGPFGEALREHGIDCLTPGKSGRWDVGPFLVALSRQLREFRPDVLYAYLSVPNLVAGLVGRWLRIPRVYWGIRNTADPKDYPEPFSRLSLYLQRWGCRMGVPHRAVCNTQAACDFLQRHGVRAERLAVIPNCVDAEAFAPDPPGRERVRAEWGIAPETPLLGVVGRIDLRKDHVNFVRTARAIADRLPEARFCMVGRMDSELTAPLRDEVRRLGLDDARLLWVDSRPDMRAVYNALDVLISSSVSEGFQNVVVEALACGTRAVATMTGAAPEILDDPRWLAPVREPVRLAEASLRRLAEAEDRESVRRGVLGRYGREALALRVEALEA